MRKKGSIYSKLRGETMSMVVISILCVCVAAYACIWYMRQNVTQTNERLGNSAALDSMAALERQEEDALRRLVSSKAEISDEKLSNVSDCVGMIRDTAERIASDPAGYAPRPAPFPDSAAAGDAAVMRLGAGVELADALGDILLMGNISNTLAAVLNNSESVASVYIGTESGVFISADSQSYHGSSLFGYRDRPWYTSAKEAGQGAVVWTDVYDDYFGRGLIITCAMPYFDAEGGFAGVAAADMLLEEISAVVAGSKTGEAGRAFIVNKDGRVVISDTIHKDGKGHIIQDDLLRGDAGFPVETARRMTSGEPGIEAADLDGSRCFVAYEPLNTLDWSFAIVTKVEEVIAPALESQRRITAMKNLALASVDRMIMAVSAVFGVIFLAFICANNILTKRLAHKLAAPIEELCEGAQIIGGGQLDYRLNVKTGDEIETLSDTFNKMLDDINAISREKARISTELAVATQIQAGILPHIFPPYPNRKELDIHAFMRPAREVGGDFYDFFLVDDNTLAVVIADVSGKGVPAALFMVIARTLIKNSASYGQSPAEVLRFVNNLLCENNEACMFVTTFLASLDIETGTLTYANAGHNPPLVSIKGEDFRFLDTRPGFVLAGWEDRVYENMEITLNPGDTLFMYTDGVTEAANKERQFYAEERLVADINRRKNLDAASLLAVVEKAVDDFADGADQADDITMLALRYRGDC